MKKQLLALLVTTATVAGVSACHSSPTDMPPGQYENKTSYTTTNGTEVTKKTNTTVGEDVYGNKTAVVNKKTSTDPKGLMNKSSSESTTVIDDSK